MATFFSEYFDIDATILDEYGAFNVSLINDLPLFIDPFLLFNSEKEEYVRLHEEIITYLKFLRDKAATTRPDSGLIRLWYCFPEVKQNWFGFSLVGNSGSGLGIEFGQALHGNLHKIFADFGAEQITEGSHLEKVCLINSGVGRDNISDFTTNLIIDYLCKYTQEFAALHINSDNVRKVIINKAVFNYKTESWERRTYQLPWIDGDFVVLTPKDMLTRDDNWINRDDLINYFDDIPTAISDGELRAQIDNYFHQVLVQPEDRYPSRKEIGEAVASTVLNFPVLIDYYIKLKEQKGDEAQDLSSQKVIATEIMFIEQLQGLQQSLNTQTTFYEVGGKTTYEEAHERLGYLKDVIENKGGHRFFYVDGEPIHREKDLQILYRLVWFGTPSDVTTEANDGRGPVDFKVSRGAGDKTLVEMKLAKNTQLERNLKNQVEIYQKASDAKRAIKAIMFFSASEEARANDILERLDLKKNPDVILIDARSDNKPSASKA